MRGVGALSFPRRLGGILVGLVAFHGGLLVTEDVAALWSIATGLGIVLVAWHGPWIAVPLAASVFCCRYYIADRGASTACAAALILPLQYVLSWWTYHKLLRGIRELDEPRSAILFLLVAAGLWCGLAATALLPFEGQLSGGWWFRLSVLWMRDALGILALAPVLLVVLTQPLVHHRFIADDRIKLRSTRDSLSDWTFAELVETIGLAGGTAVLSVIMTIMQLRQHALTWQLWGIAMILIVWAGLRQGLRASSLAAAAAALVALGISSGAIDAITAWELRGPLLAQCSTALLVGAALGWVRASEARHRQAVRDLPVVLYSVRIPRLLVARLFHGKAEGTLVQGREKKQLLPALIDVAELILVSPASKQMLGQAPDDLIGPYRNWLERIHKDDVEIVLAALGQLCLQRTPVTCEYRLAGPAGDVPTIQEGWFGSDGVFRQASHERWVRDTLAPHFDPEGWLDGWDGVVEDITQQRALALDLRRTTAMLNALLTNLPTGIYFVHGARGKPVLVNSRARQLLGQRDDLSAGIEHLSDIYRLHRPDGSPYPVKELPVVKALHEGRTCMADDIVVHRSDGRHIPLITWAAPIDLEKNDQPDSAVWVLEDLNAVTKAQLAREQSQNRLRAIIETMAEGLVVQDETGKILECNPAACSILGCTSPELIGAMALAGDCIREDGTPFPRAEQADRLALQSAQPVRDVVMGIRCPAPICPSATGDEGEGARGNGDAGHIRWLQLNATLLAPGWPDFRPRIVTTFSEITEQRRILEVVKQSKDKYQHLLESLPLVVLQIVQNGRIDYVNPAAQMLLQLDLAELTSPGVWHSRIHADDRAQFDRALSHAMGGFHSRLEFRFSAGDDSEKRLYALMQPAANSGNGAGCTCIIVDMTLQRHLEQELQRAQRLEIVGRLAGGTVHDLNNLITVMMGLAGLAQTQLPDDHPLQNDLHHILEVGEQASHLAGQLLTFSKKRQQTARIIELNTVIGQAVKILKGAILPNVALEMKLADRPFPVQADETQLKQLILNLGLNARDAMPCGGTLTIRTWSDDVTGVTLQIEDTGAGIEESIRRRIFEPFFTTKEHGSGLGLVVVRQIVENLGGRICVHSEPGKGTRFEIWLPLAETTGIDE